VKCLKLEHLLELHVLVLQETGGGEGLRDLGRLEAALAAQQQEVFGEILYKTLYEKAAAMMRSIIGGHPFVDGNKRTATLACLTFLKLNDCACTATQKELEDFAVAVAVEHLEIPVIAAWLKAHSKKA
jgi:death-on-curing protein